MIIDAIAAKGKEPSKGTKMKASNHEEAWNDIRTPIRSTLQSGGGRLLRHRMSGPAAFFPWSVADGCRSKSAPELDRIKVPFAAVARRLGSRLWTPAQPRPETSYARDGSSRTSHRLLWA